MLWKPLGAISTADQTTTQQRMGRNRPLGRWHKGRKFRLESWFPSNKIRLKDNTSRNKRKHKPGHNCKSNAINCNELRNSQSSGHDRAGHQDQDATLQDLDIWDSDFLVGNQYAKG